MIRLQIFEKDGAGLYETLRNDMRTGALRTLSLKKRGRRVEHARYSGWMTWIAGAGTITCEIRSPRKPRDEWQFLKALVGRLADRYSDSTSSISIYFPQPSRPKRAARKKRK